MLAMLLREVNTSVARARWLASAARRSAASWAPRASFAAVMSCGVIMAVSGPSPVRLVNELSVFGVATVRHGAWRH